MIKRLLLPVLTLLMLVLAFSPGGYAANQTVIDLGDSGLSGQLRQKITDCLNSGGGTIIFAQGLSGQITLTKARGPLPTITGNTGIQVTINGGGVIEISGNNSNNDGIRIFNVNAGATLTLRNLTLSHAFADGDGGAVASNGALSAVNVGFFNNVVTASWSGSAILCWGPLTITNCEFGFNSGGGGAVKPRSSGATTTITGSYFHDNQSNGSAGGGYGGAIQVFDGPTATVTNCTFDNNSAVHGGAIYVSANATLNVGNATTSTVFTGNTASRQGGGIRNDGSATVINSTFSGNRATAIGGGNAVSGGGAIHNNGALTLTNVTLNANQAPADTVSGGGGLGGGIRHDSGSATLTNVTLSGNSANYGGAIYTIGTLQLNNVTMSGNSATGGGGIFQDSNAGVVSFNNTVIAKGASGSNCHLSSSTITLSNLSDDNTCNFTSDSDFQRDSVTDLLLGPLADNGGLTKTHLPQAGSRAVDNGIAISGLTKDQRGVKRPQGPQYDVGAVEVVEALVENGHPYVQYDGWRGFKNASANGGYYRMSNITADAVTYKFTGTSLKWITRKGPDMGKAFVSVDGGTSTVYDLYSSSVLWNQQILFGNLTNTAHTIVIRVGGLKNASATDYNVALDGFLVGTSTKPVQESALTIQYNGWLGKKQTAASGGSYRISSNQGAPSVLFRFKGPTIDFITAQGPSYGYVNVLIDGNVVSSNVDLYSPTQTWKYILGYSGLANSNHTIEVRPANIKNVNSAGYGVVVDAFTGPITALP